jgi:hypothetical protein
LVRIGRIVDPAIWFWGRLRRKTHSRAQLEEKHATMFKKNLTKQSLRDMEEP